MPPAKSAPPASGVEARPSSFVRFVESPNLPLWLVLAAALLTAPSLFVGLHLDDVMGRYIYSDRPGAAELYRVYVGGYGIANGNPRDMHWQIEQGFAPWWVYPQLLLSMYRPLSLATHLFDFRLWPQNFVMMHAHSILWFALLVWAATRLYRGVMGPLVGGLAALLYAFDHTHGFAVGYMANRNTLLATAFGVLALDQYCRSRKEPSLGKALLGLFFYLCGLLSGEATIAVAGYVFAYALFVEEGTLTKRALGVVPYLVVTMVWRVIYNRMGYGAHGSGLYIDPGREPLHFFLSLLERGPILLLGQFLMPPAELYTLVPPAQSRPILVLAVLFVAVLFAALVPVLVRQRAARFWAAGMVISLVPSATPYPHNRLLFFCGLGAMGLVAELWRFYALERQAVPLSGLSRLSRATGKVLMGFHVVMSPILLPLTAASILVATPFNRAVADVGSEIENKDAIFVTEPDYFSEKVIQFTKRVDRKPLPRRWRVLSVGPQEVVVRRTDPRTLLLDYQGGILSTPFMELYRDRRLPMAPGDEVLLEGLSIVVREVTEDGRVKSAQFTFDTPLDAPSFCFYYWVDNAFKRWTPPPVGGEDHLPAAMLKWGA